MKLFDCLGLEDLLPKCREGELYRQVRCAVVFVNDRVDFDDFKAQQLTIISNDFHGEMGFAVGGPAAYWGPYSGSVFGIDPIHVEGHVISGCAVPGNANRGFHDVTHAALVDVAHSENVYARTADVFPFDGVDITHPHQYAVIWAYFRREIQDVSQFCRPKSHDGCQRHTMNVSAR